MLIPEQLNDGLPVLCFSEAMRRDAAERLQEFCVSYRVNSMISRKIATDRSIFHAAFWLDSSRYLPGVLPVLAIGYPDPSGNSWDWDCCNGGRILGHTDSTTLADLFRIRKFDFGSANPGQTCAASDSSGSSPGPRDAARSLSVDAGRLRLAR